MNKLMYPIAAVLILTGSAFTFIAAQTWQISDGYSIAFSSDDASGLRVSSKDLKALWLLTNKTLPHQSSTSPST
jgi:hypothetical protein